MAECLNPAWSPGMPSRLSVFFPPKWSCLLFVLLIVFPANAADPFQDRVLQGFLDSKLRESSEREEG